MMSRNIRIAMLMATVVVLWMVSGLWVSSDKDPAAEQDESKAVNLTQVQAGWYVEKTYRPVLEVQAATVAHRDVVVKAQLAGNIVAVLADRGAFIRSGETICEVDTEDRSSIHRSAQAAVSRAEIEHRGVLSLDKSGFQSDLAIARSSAELEAARAQLAGAREALDNLRVVAPFDGILEEHFVEPGDYVSPGAPCGRVVELDPMRVKAHVSEANIHALTLGQRAKFVDSHGRQHLASITYLGRTSDPTLRTYRVEVEISNPNLALRSGMSGSLVIDGSEVSAQLIPGAMLLLDDAGATVVKTLSEQNRVASKVVDIMGQSDKGIWVRGLPSRIALITVGQNYVVEGEHVAPRFDAESTSRLQPR